MTWAQRLKWFLLLLIVTVGAAFTVQNMGRTTALSLDLYWAAWKLAQPVAVPVLIWSSFGAGLLLAGTWGWLRGVALERKVRRLEHEAAFNVPKDDWTRGAKSGVASG